MSIKQLEEIKESFDNDIFCILEDYDSLYLSYTDIQLDEEIETLDSQIAVLEKTITDNEEETDEADLEPLGTEEDEEVIADKEGEDGDDDIEEKISKTKGEVKRKKMAARKKRLKSGVSDAEYKKQRRLASKKAKLDIGGKKKRAIAAKKARKTGAGKRSLKIQKNRK
jgi:hypothetical protein